jgi:hypothetical protein
MQVNNAQTRRLKKSFGDNCRNSENPEQSISWRYRGFSLAAQYRAEYRIVQFEKGRT